MEFRSIPFHGIPCKALLYIPTCNNQNSLFHIFQGSCNKEDFAKAIETLRLMDLSSEHKYAVLVAFFSENLSRFVEYANNHHTTLSKPTALTEYITNIGEITSDGIIQSFGEYLRKHTGGVVIQGTVLVVGPNNLGQYCSAYQVMYSISCDKWVNNIVRDLSDIPIASLYSVVKKKFLKIEPSPLPKDNIACNAFE